MRRGGGGENYRRKRTGEAFGGGESRERIAARDGCPRSVGQQSDLGRPRRSLPHSDAQRRRAAISVRRSADSRYRSLFKRRASRSAARYLAVSRRKVCAPQPARSEERRV